jgi:hypothetical protein
MPTPYTYPGVYVEENPSGVRTITGISTSDTAFIDFFALGPVDRAVRIGSFADFERCSAASIVAAKRVTRSPSST